MFKYLSVNTKLMGNPCLAMKSMIALNVPDIDRNLHSSVTQYQVRRDIRQLL